MPKFQEELSSHQTSDDNNIDRPTKPVFTYIGEVDEDLECSICKEPLLDPQHHRDCGNMFCSPCISLWSESNGSCPICRTQCSHFEPVAIKYITNRLNSLNVLCNTCGSQMNRNLYKDHVETCPVECEKGCGIKVAPKNREEHLNSHCVLRKVCCPAIDVYCDWTGASKDLSEHKSHCQFLLLKPVLSKVIQSCDEKINFLLEGTPKFDVSHFNKASDSLRSDREFILRLTKRYPSIIEHATEQFRVDKEFLLKAVKQNGISLQFASEELKKDREIVLEAVKQNGYSLADASEGLKKDREIVLEAVKQNGYSLQFASEELKKDREVVLEAVKQNGISLRFASKELKKDNEIVLEQQKSNSRLRY